MREFQLFVRRNKYAFSGYLIQILHKDPKKTHFIHNKLVLFKCQNHSFLKKGRASNIRRAILRYYVQEFCKQYK